MKLLIKVTSWRFYKLFRLFNILSGLTKSLTVCNFGNTVAMTIFFVQKMFKIDVDSTN